MTAETINKTPKTAGESRIVNMRVALKVINWRRKVRPVIAITPLTILPRTTAALPVSMHVLYYKERQSVCEVKFVFAGKRIAGNNIFPLKNKLQRILVIEGMFILRIRFDSENNFFIPIKWICLGSDD